MKDYSIENAQSFINSEITKKYFKEVSSSYFNGNYRAAVVALYSVVIIDILLKLEFLEEIYADPAAISILQGIRTYQAEHPNNSDWEKDIIEKIKNRTNLLDNVDYAHILSLRADRHLCAHPVLNKEATLYTPNKETVASHMRNMLESLFLKPAILSKKILSTMLVDIAAKKDLLLDQASLEKYIKSKYLNSLNPSVETAIFRDLWKFVFILENEEASENRDINYKVLYLLYARNTATCIEKIKSEQHYFSNILDDKNTISLLVYFLAENEFLYREFRDDVHLLINRHIERSASSKTVAWFINQSYLHHLEVVKNGLRDQLDTTFPSDASGSAYYRILKIGFTKGYIKEVTDFIIWRYSVSRNYDDADKIFAYAVRPGFHRFTEEQFIELCKCANENPQTYGRRRAEVDHSDLRKQIEIKFGSSFDFTAYQNLFSHLS